MSKRILAGLAALLLALPGLAVAKDLTGKIGLGYFNSEAPLGVRYWFTPDFGIDVGFGFESRDVGTQNATSIALEAGIPYVAYATEQANLFLRVGGLLQIVDDRLVGGMSNDSWTVFDLIAGPGAEVFFGDHFSLEASHGIDINIQSPPVGDSATNFATGSGSVTELGFHFYF